MTQKSLDVFHPTDHYMGFDEYNRPVVFHASKIPSAEVLSQMSTLIREEMSPEQARKLNALSPDELASYIMTRIRAIIG